MRGYLIKKELKNFREAYMEAEREAGLKDIQLRDLEEVLRGQYAELDGALARGDEPYAMQIGSLIAELEERKKDLKLESIMYHNMANMVYIKMTQLEAEVPGRAKKIKKVLKVIYNEAKSGKTGDAYRYERMLNDIRKLQEATRKPRSKISGRDYIPKRAREIVEERRAKLETQSELERRVKEKAGIAADAISA